MDKTEKEPFTGRRRGRLGGRPRKIQKDRYDELRKLYEAEELTVQEIADFFGVTRPTIYRILHTIYDK
jgi:DNA invertase Pin-like site-specific DNA recombinase